MTIKQLGGVFGRNPTFNDVTIDGELILNGEIFTGLDFQGSWNASTNTPTLASGVGTTGEFYIVSVAGTTNLDGITNWGVGDWAMFSGSAWQRVEGNADGNFVNLSVSNEATFPDNAKAIFGTGSDLQIYHDGSHSYIKDTATGNLRIDGTDIQIRSDAGANMAAFVTGAEVQLYHNNQKKFETTATGIDVTGSVTADGLTVNSTNNSGNTGTPTIVLKDLDVTVSAGQFTGAVEFETSDTNNPGVNSYIRSVMTGTGGGGSLKFGTGFAGSLADRVLIGGNGDISFYDDAAAQGLFWDSSASALGIGTTTVNADLHLGAASPHIDIGPSTGNRGKIGYDTNNVYIGSTSGTGEIHFKNNIGSTDAPNASGDTKMVIADSGVGIGTDSPLSALNVKGTQGNWRVDPDSVSNEIQILTTTTANDGFRDFRLRTNETIFETGATEAMRIDSSGNVGIGTSSAIAGGLLSLAQGSNTHSLVLDSATSAAPSLYLRTLGGTATQANITFNDSTSLVFTTTTAERLRIDSSGNVGIGTDAPASALELSGAATANARLTLSQTTASLSSEIQQGSTGLAISAVGSQPVLLQTNGAERMRIDASGNLLVGTATADGDGLSIKPRASGGATTTQLLFDRADTTTEGFTLVFHNNSTLVGSISHTNSATSFNTSSDQRLKENIVDAPSASDDIDAIQVRSFDWKADGSHQKYGMVAQELQSVAPSAVSQPEDPDEIMGVDYSKLVPMLVKEIQSLRARVAQLES